MDWSFHADMATTEVAKGGMRRKKLHRERGAKVKSDLQKQLLLVFLSLALPLPTSDGDRHGL